MSDVVLQCGQELGAHESVEGWFRRVCRAPCRQGLGTVLVGRVHGVRAGAKVFGVHAGGAWAHAPVF